MRKFDKCGYVWLDWIGRHVCDRIKDHGGPHKCEACEAVTEAELKEKPNEQ